MPAQGNGKFSYTVDLNQSTCECKNYETQHEKCKHIVAAEIISGVEDKKEEEINLEEVYQVSAGKIRNLSQEFVASYSRA
ncbi:SWIM zinc finger family protein [Acetomicrobium flavidum]|uniref:SWIM zinc finger family protein n=1 Tax=Acetomicrobium flavidum TaxID=49896 RepID=UPI00384BF924